LIYQENSDHFDVERGKKGLKHWLCGGVGASELVGWHYGPNRLTRIRGENGQRPRFAMYQTRVRSNGYLVGEKNFRPAFLGPFGTGREGWRRGTIFQRIEVFNKKKGREKRKQSVPVPKDFGALLKLEGCFKTNVFTKKKRAKCKV